MAVQAVLNHRGQYGLPREAKTLLPNSRQPGDYPLTEHEIGAKLAAGADRVGADPRIMTPAEEVEFVHKQQYLAGKLTTQELEARAAEEDIRARAAERAVYERRDQMMMEQARVREEQQQNYERQQQLAEETWQAEQEWSQSLYEDWKREQITKEERANREATLLSPEEIRQANYEAQQLEIKTQEELSQWRLEALSEKGIKAEERYGFSELKSEEVYAPWDPWGGRQSPDTVAAEEIQSQETAKAVGMPPGPATGEMPKPQTRSARYLPGEVIDTLI